VVLSLEGRPHLHRNALYGHEIIFTRTILLFSSTAKQTFAVQTKQADTLKTVLKKWESGQKRLPALHSAGA
jgi:hypothetical protein